MYGYCNYTRRYQDRELITTSALRLPSLSVCLQNHKTAKETTNSLPPPPITHTFTKISLPISEGVSKNQPIPLHYYVHSSPPSFLNIRLSTNENPAFGIRSQWHLPFPRRSAALVGPAAGCYHHCPPLSATLLLLLDALSSLVQGDESLLYSAMFCRVLKLVAAAGVPLGVRGWDRGGCCRTSCVHAGTTLSV
jgi:hypothetical protein